MDRKLELTDRIAVVDETGGRHTLEQWETFVDMTKVNSVEPEWAPISREFRLNGGAVNRVDDQTFLVVATRMTLRRV
ncbi:hypothetical protein [Bordetella trematum]|uniref:hypothetical protein n=1 Tax=Bordetella trematum TaxID=123899 RepID=UPI003989019E